MNQVQPFSKGSERSMLDADDFRRLVRGEVIRVQTSQLHEIELALKDIGFAVMREAIREAEDA